MKSTGHVRRLSQTGQLTIPADVRAILGIQADDDLEIEPGAEGQIVIRRVVPACRFCGSSTAKPAGPNGALVCDDCMEAAAIMANTGDPDG